MITLLIKKLHPDAKIPEYGREGDAAFDLYSIESVNVPPHTQVSIKTGLALEIPFGYAGLIWDKSGLSHTHGLKTFGGVIDAGYRGEISIGIMNLSNEEYVFEKGHKVAQMLIQKVETVGFEEVFKLSESERGDGGFGSSGK